MGSGGEMWALYFIPCVPWLLLFPALAYQMPEEFVTRNESIFFIGFLIGIIVYAAVTYCLYAWMVDSFPRLAGRTYHKFETLRDD
jgi:hypothetical protein